MNGPQILILVVALTTSPILFLIMRYPQFRRSQFRDSDPFSFSVSLLCALTLFCLLALMADLQ